MAIASLANIEKTFGRRVIFDKLNFSIDRGERVGLIGDNGSGKTTLFKTLTGQIMVDLGTVAIAKSIRWGYLTQDPVFDPANTVVDEAELAFAELHKLSHQMRDLEHEMAEAQGDALQKVLNEYQEVQHDFDLAGGYAWRHRLEATLLGVGLDRPIWEQNVSTLSGGQKSRLALAKLLIAQSDLLLLDEPTNHLDLTAIAWLEDYLASFSGAVLIISHDRYLLDRLATRIVWLTGAKLKSYPGNYSSFVEQRELQELTQQRAYEEQQADIEKQAEFIRRFGAGQRSKEAKGRLKRLERLLKSDEMISAVATDQKIKVSLGTEQRAGDRVLSVKELSKGYDSRMLWNDVSLDFARGEKVGIIGPNGSGKTTLLEILLGRREADSGELRWGSNLKIGYYDQKLGDFKPQNTVTEEVKGSRTVPYQELRGVLGMMLFRGEDADKPMHLLSGGERARVAMAKLLIDKPNVLMLDEPTNHLDINSCEALENAMQAFEGTIFCVSHDRYFLDKIINRLLILQPPKVASFEGNYTEWVRKTKERTKEHNESRSNENRKGENRKGQDSKKNAPKPAAPPPGNSNSQAKQGNPQQKSNPWARPFGRLSTPDLEKQISETEIALAECQNLFGDSDLAKDSQRSRKVQADFEMLSKKLKQLEEEYFTRNQ